MKFSNLHAGKILMVNLRIVAPSLAALFWLFSMSGCGPVKPDGTVQSLPASYHQGGKRFEIDLERSEIRLLVYRDGPLARLGHNHVITGRVQGNVYVAERIEDCGFRLEIPLDLMKVDLPDPRSEEGADFASIVTESAREGTRNNMLGKQLLDMEKYPSIKVQSFGLAGNFDQPQVKALVLIHGALQELNFPAQILPGEKELKISASFRILQSELGLQPFSVMGGALRVRDAVDVRMKLLAVAKNPSE